MGTGGGGGDTVRVGGAEVGPTVGGPLIGGVLGGIVGEGDLTVGCGDGVGVRLGVGLGGRAVTVTVGRGGAGGVVWSAGSVVILSGVSRVAIAMATSAAAIPTSPPTTSRLCRAIACRMAPAAPITPVQTGFREPSSLQMVIKARRGRGGTDDAATPTTPSLPPALV